MSNKEADVKSLILVDLDKYNSLAEKSKKLNNLQHQQVNNEDECTSQATDPTKQSYKDEQAVEEKVEANEKDLELKKTIYGTIGGQSNEEEKDNEIITLTNWFKVL